jgi:hypothetical protein
MRFLAKINTRLKPWHVWLSVGFNFSYIEVFLEYKLLNRTTLPAGEPIRPFLNSEAFASSQCYRDIAFLPIGN